MTKGNNKNKKMVKVPEKKKKSNPTGGSIKGHGDYYTDKVKPFLQRNIPKGSLSKIGAMLGAHLGGPGGSAFGGYGGGKLAELLGYGDYTVAQNSLGTVGGALPMGEEVPKFAVSARGTRIVHREYIGDIISPGQPFTLTGYSLNPLNTTLFPWMSTIAQLYQQYKFNGMVFEFKSMSSEFAAGSALGTVIMTTNYNANQPLFDNKIEMENTEFAVSAKPSLCQMHCIECDPKERVTEYLYVQPNQVGIGLNDARLTSFGNFQLATTGLSAGANQVIGELWVSYDITLLKPVLNSNVTTCASTTISNPTPTGANTFGTSSTILNANLPAFTYSPTVNNVLVFLYPGTYTMILSGTFTALNGPPFTLGAGLGVTGVQQQVAFSLTSVVQTFRVVTTMPNGQLSVNLFGGGTFGSVANVQAKVIKVDSAGSGY